jgi:hypothetical protein
VGAPRNRAEAVAWAREVCGRIVAGEFDREPRALFNAAQRVEVVLCQWQWLDDGFPRTVLPFVEGWHISGDEADTAIRDAALALVEDPTPDGAPVQGAYGDSLVGVDEIVDF